MKMSEKKILPSTLVEGKKDGKVEGEIEDNEEHYSAYGNNILSHI